MTAYLLNLLDLSFTLYALSHGATELNPLMRNATFMIAYKVIVVGALLGWLSERKERFGIIVCTAVFAVVDVWHIVNLALR